MQKFAEKNVFVHCARQFGMEKALDFPLFLSVNTSN